MGLAEIFRHLTYLFGFTESSAILSDKKDMANVKPRFPAMEGLAIVFVFVFIGASPWLIKGLAPPRYPDQSASTLTARISSIANAPARQDINEFVSQTGSYLQTGRLLYPRFFYRNSGLTSANPSTAYLPRDYPRFGFIFINQGSIPAVFPTREILHPFPHGSDAIVLGCQREGYLEVKLIAFPELNIFYGENSLSDPCSP
jgi:hypothetical protein